jgi:hypothetical protein
MTVKELGYRGSVSSSHHRLQTVPEVKAVGTWNWRANGVEAKTSWASLHDDQTRGYFCLDSARRWWLGNITILGKTLQTDGRITAEESPNFLLSRRFKPRLLQYRTFELRIFAIFLIMSKELNKMHYTKRLFAHWLKPPVPLLYHD